MQHDQTKNGVMQALRSYAYTRAYEHSYINLCYPYLLRILHGDMRDLLILTDKKGKEVIKMDMKLYHEISSFISYKLCGCL